MSMNIPKINFSEHTLFNYSNAVPPNLIKEILAEINSREFEKATVTGGDLQNDLHEIRSTMIQWINPESWIGGICNNLLMASNSRYFFYDLTQWIDGIQVTVYEEGDHYGWHTDCTSYLKAPDALDRKLSMSLLLNDNYEGGELEFQYQPLDKKIKPKAGEAIIFPSWLPHRVLPVTKGKRISIVAWLSGPVFK